MTELVIRAGRVVDPGRGIDRPADLVLRDGRVAGVEPPGTAAVGHGATVVDAAGGVVLPGLNIVQVQEQAQA